MLRVCLAIVLPLVLPTALYLAWIILLGAPRDGGGVSWSAVPWLWLAGAGAALLAIVLFVVTVGFGTAEPGVYVAPRWQNGRIVPGHMVPAPNEPASRR
jgi:hypothetical protein